MPLLLLFDGAFDDDPPNVKLLPVLDPPKPEFEVVFVLKGLFAVFDAPKPLLVFPPPPNSELPVFVDPNPPEAGLFWPNSPIKLLECCIRLESSIQSVLEARRF